MESPKTLQAAIRFFSNEDNCIAYICGNPDMIIAAEETLLGRGFPEAQVKKELYWPKGKEPTGGASEE